MEIEQQDEGNNDQIDFEPLNLRGDKRLTLNNDAQHLALAIHSKRHKKGELNAYIDPKNIAKNSPLSLRVKQFGDFQHFLTKNKNRDQREKVLEQVRRLAEQKNIVLNGRVKDKLEKSRMIIRIVGREEKGSFVTIEDQTGKEKMHVRNGFGIVWIGMIICAEVGWSEATYRLDSILDLGIRTNMQKAVLREPNTVYRMLFLKGPFYKNQTRDNIGLRILIDELTSLKKERVRVNCIVIFGPLLSIRNTALKNMYWDKTYDEEAVGLIQLIRDQIYKVDEDIQVVLSPSTDDLTTFYPIPQPKYSHCSEFEHQNINFISNPGFLILEGSRQEYHIDLINQDVLFYIDQNKVGSTKGDIKVQNLETYFKQPFYLTNSQDQPFDETNLPGLYNQGKFGDIIITTSEHSPPFANDIKGRVYVNVGTLGMGDSQANRHYMTLLSIYEGQGSIAGRTKVEVLSM